MNAPEKATPAGGPASAVDQGRKPAQFTAAADTLQSDEKQFATLAAEAALIGASLHRLDDGTLLLSRWAWGKQLPSLDDVAALLRRMRGQR